MATEPYDVLPPEVRSIEDEVQHPIVSSFPYFDKSGGCSQYPKLIGLAVAGCGTGAGRGSWNLAPLNVGKSTPSKARCLFPSKNIVPAGLI